MGTSIGAPTPGNANRNARTRQGGKEEMSKHSYGKKGGGRNTPLDAEPGHQEHAFQDRIQARAAGFQDARRHPEKAIHPGWNVARSELARHRGQVPVNESRCAG